MSEVTWDRDLKLDLLKIYETSFKEIETEWSMVKQDEEFQPVIQLVLPPVLQPVFQYGEDFSEGGVAPLHKQKKPGQD